MHHPHLESKLKWQMADLREFKKEYDAGSDQAQKYRTDEYGNPIYEQKGGAAGYGVTTGDYGATPHEGALGGGGKTGPQSGKAAYGAAQTEYRAHAGDKKAPPERAAAKIPDRL